MNGVEGAAERYFEGCDVLGVLHETDVRVLARVRSSGDAQAVIVKLLMSEHPTPTEMARLHHECTIAQAIPGEGLVRPLRVQAFGRRVGLVLEDTRGTSLAAAIPPDGLAGLGACLRIGLSLARAIAGVHEAEVLHRDVKPANVIVDTDLTEARLADFGIATRLPRVHAEAAPPSRLVGTLAYMAPEQTGRMSRSVDHRSDLYALGVTLYQMLTGRLPFPTDDALELVHCHLAVVPEAPDVLDPALPATVSAIVLRLLAKAPEDRYQSAAALARDLARAHASWLATGTVEEFAPAGDDVPMRLEIPERLYGRSAEAAALAGIVEDVAGGGCALALLSGPAGIGKTALVGELRRPVAGLRGHYVAGKFDQFTRDVPYASLVQAFATLVRQLLAEPAESIAAWQVAIAEALGPNAAVVVDVIPELRMIVGDVPPVVALGPVEAANRFNLTFSRFVGVFAQPGRPLVLFLDDLHWADSASLKLLATLLRDPDAGNLLVVGAYRPAEVSASHPLTLTLDAVPAEFVRRLEVPALGLDAVCGLTADALHAEPADVVPLARFLHDRTGGNPFFLGQLLRSSADQHLVHRTGGRWVWDLAALHAADMPTDVVEFMTGRLAGLPEPCRRALQLAAVIGNRFPLDLLAAALGEPAAAAAARLWPAITAGLVLPLGQDHELVGSGLMDAQVGYRFLHDRVQQSGHATIAEGDLPGIHRAVAALLSERAEGDDLLFEIVDHLNTAAGLTGLGADLDLALLNLRAARRAKAATAFEAADAHLAATRRLLPADAWAAHYDATYEAHALHGEVLSALGRIDEAEEAFVALLAAARSDVDRARGWAARGEALFVCNRIAEALEAFKSGLRTLDIPLEHTPERAAEVMARLREPAAVERLLATSPGGGRAALANRLFGMASFCGYFLFTPDFAYVVGRGVEQIVDSGTHSVSGLSIAFLAMELARTGHLEQAIAYAEAAVTLLGQDADDPMRGPTTMFAWSYCLLWTHDVDAYVRIQRDLFWTCQNAGAMLHANYAIVWEYMALYTVGRDLAELLSCVERTIDHGRRFAPQLLAMWPVFIDMIHELTGAQDRSEAGFDRPAAVGELEVTNLIAAWVAFAELAWHHTLLGEYATAHDYGVRAGVFRGIAGGTPTSHAVVNVEAGDAIACARLATAAGDPEERTALLAEADAAAARLGAVTRMPPFAYSAFSSLAAAEIARARGDDAATQTAYLAAIDAAALRDYPLVQGLANELLGREHRARGRSIGTVHLREARALYLRCGAKRKAEFLDTEFPDLVEAPRRRSFAATGTTTLDGTVGDADLATVVKASREIAAELAADRLVERLVAVAVELSGARNGAFAGPDEALPSVAGGGIDLPIVRNDERAGTLRLTFAADPNPDRVGLVRLLVPQMAISLENAHLYAGLENQVAERSAELSATLDELRLMQDQIITSEKLAALGGLVAGVAHEVSTPIGVAVTAASHLADRATAFGRTAAGGQLRRSDLESFLSGTAASGELILDNLRRAAEFVTSFKEVAVDSSSEALRTIEIGAYLATVVASLHPKLAASPHAVEIQCPAEVTVTTYAGALAQIVTNLLLNSLAHAYEPGTAGTLRLYVEAHGDTAVIRYTDDGRGIDNAALPRIFDPFFTTNRAAGGSGLGLHIVHNLVTGRLDGTIAAASTPGQGVAFTITLPRVGQAASTTPAVVAR